MIGNEDMGLRVSLSKIRFLLPSQCPDSHVLFKVVRIDSVSEYDVSWIWILFEVSTFFLLV